MSSQGHELQAFGPRGSEPGRGTQRTLYVPDNANLKEVAEREGLPLFGFWGRFLNCGGEGRCQSCRVVIRSGPDGCSPPTPMERRTLSNAKTEDRLGCQVQVRGPISVTFPRPLPLIFKDS